jgi:hypothetical protein
MITRTLARQFNPLERTLLDWFAQHRDLPKLEDQLKGASVLRREYSASSQCVWLRLAPEVECMPAKGRHSPVRGPGILSKDIDEGGSVQLWINEEGFVDCLEMWSNGGSFPQQLSEFRIIDLAVRHEV